MAVVAAVGPNTQVGMSHSEVWNKLIHVQPDRMELDETL